MKKTKFSSVLLLSAACLLASCGNRAITPTSTSSPTEPASTSIVTPSTPATTSQDPIPSEQSQESEESIPSEQSQESAEPTSSEQTPDVSSGPAQDSSGDTPVSHVFAGTKNGVALELVDLKKEDWTCLAYYSLDLVKDDKIVLTLDGVAVPFKSNDGELGTEFVAPRDGTYQFYINSATECWVDLPTAPVGDHVFAGTKNGVALELVDLKEEGWACWAYYKLDLVKDDKIVLTVDGTPVPFTSDDGELGTEFVAPRDGTYQFYINSATACWVGIPAAPTPAAKVLKIEVNGTEVNRAPEENPDDNAAVYKITLAIGDKLVVKGDGVALPLGDSESTEFTCKVAGEHTVYVNKEYKVYVSEPTAPVGDHVFAGTKNGVALDLVNLKEEGWDCWAYYKLDLVKDDKIVLTVDGTPVPFRSNDGALGTEFVAPRDETYKFYINSATDCWVDIPVLKQEIKVNLEGWIDSPNQVVFAHSWKGEAPNQQTLDEKVADGKFNVIDGCDGFILICCQPGTTEIIWDGEGRNVVKQTGDLTVQEGSLAYSAEEDTLVWVVPQA